MALIKVYEWEFYSTSGSKFKIELHQDDGTPLASGLRLGADGFVMTTKADEDDRYSPIIGTEVSIPVLIDDATAETFINSIVLNQEKSAFVKIYTFDGSDYQIFYRGIVLQDLAKNEDAYYPYQFNISATDGFGRLKNIDFNDTGTAYTGSASLLTVFRLALEKIGLDTLFETTDPYIYSGIDVREVNASPGDTLERTRVKHNVFYREDANGKTFLSSYEVVEQICRRFGLRIVQLSGAWHVVSVNRHNEPGLTNFYRYSKTGTALSGELARMNLISTQYRKLSGSSFNLYPALKLVESRYNYRQTEYPVSFVPTTGPYGVTAYTELDAGGGEALGFNLSANINFTSNGNSLSFFRVRFKVTLYVGSNWLLGEGNTMQWIPTTNSFYYFYSQFINAQYSQIISAGVDLVTPPLLAGGLLNFGFTVDGLEDANGNSFTLPSGNLLSYQYYAQIYYIGASLEIAEGQEITYAQNDVESANIYQTPELIIGDAIYTHDVGRIQIFNGSIWVNSEEWDVDTDYGGIPLAELLTNEILSGQKIPTGQIDFRSFIRINQTFAERCNPVAMGFVTSSDIYVPLSASYAAGTDEVSGTFFIISRNISDITNDVTYVPVGLDADDNTNFGDLSVNNQDGIDVITSQLTGTITTIPVSGLGDAIISKGDLLTILDPTTGKKETVTASANVASGATSIPINSVALTNEYGLGTVVTYNKTQTVRKSANPRLTQQTLTGDGSVGYFDVTILDGSSSTVSASLLPAADVINKVFHFLCTDSTNECTISASSLINGESSLTVKEGESIRVYSDGSTYHLLSSVQNKTRLRFDTDFTYPDAIEAGELRWSEEDGTLEIGMGYDDVVQQVGQELYYDVVTNRGATTLVQGTIVSIDTTQVVQGNRFRVVKSNGDGTEPAKIILGMLTMDIAPNQTGFCTYFGMVRTLSISELEAHDQKDVAETWAEGDILWLHPSASYKGGMTNVEPNAPNLKIPCAVIKKLNGDDLTVFVRFGNTSSLNDIHDVRTFNPATLPDGYVLRWNGTGKYAEFSTFSGATETDPVFVASAAYGITSGDITNWDAAFSWGDHSLEGYLTSLPAHTLGDHSDVSISAVQVGHGIFWDGSNWVNSAPPAGGGGTVTSVGISVPTGFDVANSPITTSGTIALSFATGYSLPTDTEQGQWSEAYSWGDHSLVGYLTSFTETDPIFSSSAAFGITSGDITSWTAAYNNMVTAVSFSTSTGVLTLTQQDAGTLTVDLDGRYLTSFTETDPIFSASVAAGITLTNVNNWNSAYDDIIQSASFSTSNGVLTLTRRDSGTVTVDLDGRYLQSYTETDPVFSASVAAGITSTQVSNWTTAYNNMIISASFNTGNGVLTLTQQDAGTVTVDLDGRYLTSFTETDPIFTSSVAFSITNTNVTQWSLAYSWGDHSLAGYLTSYTETDPIFSASAASGIVAQDIANWDGAYDNMITGIDFTSGVLTLTQQDLGTLQVNLDGRYYLASNPDGYTTNTGTVTSVNFSVPTGFSLSGNPITTAGTIALGFATGYSLPTNAMQGEWSTAYSWGDHSLAGYLTSYTETDPIFSASAASGITSTDINNWNSAYNDTIESGAFNTSTGVLRLTQRDAGTIDVNLDGRYLTSFTETDPFFLASVAYGIDAGDISNWDSAYNNSITAIAFNAGTGALTLTQQDLGTLSTNLDGRYYLASNPAGYTTNTGTVTSVDLAAPIGFAVTGNPITSSGIISLSFASGYSLPTNAMQANWDAAFGWGDHAAAGYYLASNPAGYTTNDGTVTSVNVSVPNGFQVSGAPITTSGTIAITFDPLYSLPLLALQDAWSTAYNNMIVSASFNIGNGELTLTQHDTDTIVVDLDGRYYLDSNPNGYTSNLGTVTSVGLSIPTGFSVSGSPVTTSGTIALGFASGYSLPTDAEQSNWDTAFGWGNHATAGYLTSYTETDPIFSASAAYSITTVDIANWELARIQTFKCDVTDGVASVGDNYTFRVPYAFKITEIRASATKAPVGQNLTIRLYYNGSNLTDPARPLTIDDGDRTSTTSANNYVLLTTDLSDDDEIKVEITQVGSSSAGEEIKFYLIGINAT